MKAILIAWSDSESDTLQALYVDGKLKDTAFSFDADDIAQISRGEPVTVRSVFAELGDKPFPQDASKLVIIEEEYLSG